MTQPVTWEGLIASGNYIGGELSVKADGNFYRGPIAAINEAGNNIRFTVPWMAKMSPVMLDVWFASNYIPPASS